MTSSTRQLGSNVFVIAFERWLKNDRKQSETKKFSEKIAWQIDSIMLGKCVSAQGSCDDVSRNQENLPQVWVLIFIISFHLVFCANSILLTIIKTTIDAIVSTLLTAIN